MSAIPFTQFMRPSGRPHSVSIDRPEPVSKRAEEIIAAGYRFECEVLDGGTVSFTIADDEGDHAIELAPNGPAVRAAVDLLVMDFKIPAARSKGGDDGSA